MVKQTLILENNQPREIVISEDTQLIIENCAATSVDFKVTVLENVKATIMMLNHSEKDVVCHESYQVQGQLVLGYIETMLHSVTRETKIDLTKPNASCYLQTASVCAQQLDYDLQINHLAPDTTGDIKNYGIVWENAKWNIVACGKINKGMKRSASHQKTKILTFGDTRLVKAIPLLLIDEQDVQASHGLSLGQPNPEQLYYLQSRGLSREDAIRLITIGYLLPICDLVDDVILQKKLKNEIEERVFNRV